MRAWYERSRIGLGSTTLLTPAPASALCPGAAKKLPPASSPPPSDGAREYVLLLRFMGCCCCCCCCRCCWAHGGGAYDLREEKPPLASWRLTAEAISTRFPPLDER